MKISIVTVGALNYFGPLVTTAVILSKEQELLLEEIKLHDLDYLATKSWGEMYEIAVEFANQHGIRCEIKPLKTADTTKRSGTAEPYKAFRKKKKMLYSKNLKEAPPR